MTATKAKPFPPDGKLQADILISGVTTIDNPAARNWYLDVTSTNPMGVTNQELINRAALGRQPGPEEHDSRNDVLTSAKRAEERKHTKYDTTASARQQGQSCHLSRSKRRAGTVPPPLRRCTMVLALEKANARLGSAGGRAAGQVQEGRLVRATPRARSPK
jgi:hypothetical protein